MISMSEVTGDQAIRSTCGLSCGMYRGCGIVVRLRNGRVTRIEGDEASPVNRGVLCPKGLAALEYLFHPDRLKHPLKRLGDRGEGKWQQISWDEALDVVASELTRIRDVYGPESVAFIHGANKGLQDSYMARLANVFGSPNVVWQGHVCMVPTIFASKITHGNATLPDYEYPPALSIVWGINTFETRHVNYEKLARAVDRGTKLVVIDPRGIGLAKKADLWMQLKPGSDLALALGMLNVIVSEELFDKSFVNNWTVGFDKLRAHVSDYSPEWTERTTWVKSETIREAARLYATSKPSCIESGNAIECNANSFQTARAISILRAVTGNIGVPGGELELLPLPLVGRRSPELELWHEMPADKWQNRVGANLEIIPILRYVLPQSIVKAIIEGDPYPIHVAYIQGCNPLLTYPNANDTFMALNKLDFLVVADMFMTPTAALADIVLPAASYLEFDSIVSPRLDLAQVQQKVAEIGECWSDYKILSRLAVKLGLGEYFWEDEERCLDAVLKPVGLTFKEFRKVGAISVAKQYRGYEGNGFQTPSGKVEIYSSQLEEWGFDPLPLYDEQREPSCSAPELAKEYPLILTSWKSGPFIHSGGRQIASLRGAHPEPVINIHPETASQLGISEGDQVYIETKRGRIKQKATLTTSVSPRVVGVDDAWWFPEKGISSLYGWAESNINILTDNAPPYNREIGSTSLRGIRCKVYRASSQAFTHLPS